VRESSVLLQLMFDLEVDHDFARHIVEETARGARGASPVAVTPPDVAMTVRSEGELGKEGAAHQATLRSSTESRGRRAHQAAGLTMEGGWDDASVTERR